MKALMTLAEAAEQTPFSEATLRRASNSTEPGKFPPPLYAKRDSKGRRMVTDTELRRWCDSLDDA